MTITRPARTRHGALLGVIIAASVILAGGIFFGAWAVDSVLRGPTFGFTASYAAPGWPEVASAVETQQFYDSIRIESDEPLLAQRLLSALSTSLPYLTVIAGAAGVITLARRLMRSRPFAGAARALLWVLTTLSASLAIARPWLDVAAAEGATRVLGLPTDGNQVADPTSDAWIVNSGFDLQDVDWPYLVIAAVLALVALLWRQAARFQQDTEGLV
ncbi:MAG: hypothetical protein ACTHZX_10225 [Microbacterium sp.]